MNLKSTFNYVIKKGKFQRNKPVNVRVLSKKFNLNTINLNDKKLKKSLDYLNKFNEFAFIIVKDQKTPKQQIIDEYRSNILRYYGIGAQIIKDLGINKMILVGRSKKKVIGLEGYGIKIVKQRIIK